MLLTTHNIVTLRRVPEETELHEQSWENVNDFSDDDDAFDDIFGDGTELADMEF
jgi:hypothetical protein